MRLYFALPYFLIEAIAFWGVSRWLGTGVALILLFACLFGGLILAAWEMQNISRKLSRGTASAGRAVGDLGLIGAGAMGVAMPGFVTSIVGLLLICTPTRALVRNLLAKKLRTKIEELGAKSFEATNAYRQQAHYGSFAQPHASEQVIDEEEIQSWTRNLRPEDFGTDGSGSNDSGRK